jgi:exopolyphosphatase/guanosine-5'-triphosphate,3'-diphosphate pyrophosphatase
MAAPAPFVHYAHTTVGHSPAPVAIIDIGSNSGRMVVVELDMFGHLDVLETEGTPLRLVHELATGNKLGTSVVERTVEALCGFRAIARGMGADEVLAVATSAVREAEDGEAFIQRLRDQTGIHIEVISGETEARYGFVGGVHGVPVHDGVLMDIGGGSVQLARFHDRRLTRSWSLPLGSLRLSDRFLQSDPPSSTELRRLQDHVRDTMRSAGTPTLGRADQVVGTGGTLRNLAKLDRGGRVYPIRRLHGYTLAKRDLADLVKRLAEQTGAQRAGMPGLNVTRFDSIVGGAACALAALEALGGSELLVSGQGLREGIALARLGEPLPSPHEVRGSSIAALAARFTTWREDLARQRTRAVMALQQALAPELGPELAETLRYAATLLDIGRSVDFYSRFDHAASMVLAADLSGFSHRSLALLSATIKSGEKDSGSLKMWAPLLTTADQPLLARLGALLGLAESIARQSPPDGGAEVVCVRVNGRLMVRARGLDAWLLQPAMRRVQMVFAVPLELDVR